MSKFTMWSTTLISRLEIRYIYISLYYTVLGPNLWLFMNVCFTESDCVLTVLSPLANTEIQERKWGGVVMVDKPIVL